MLDLARVLGVGHAGWSEAPLAADLRNVGIESVLEEDLHALLDEVCSPRPSAAAGGDVPASSSPLARCQVSLGLQLPKARAAAGEEYCDWMSDPLVRHLHRIRTRRGNVEAGAQTANYGLLLAGAEGPEAAALMTNIRMPPTSLHLI